jgi:hypothetical protein
MFDPLAGLIVVPLAWAALTFVLGPRRGAWTAIFALAAQFWLAFDLAQKVRAGGTVLHAVGGWGAPLGIDLAVDGLSMVMLLLTQAVALPLAFYARAYFAEEQAGLTTLLLATHRLSPGGHERALPVCRPVQYLRHPGAAQPGCGGAGCAARRRTTDLGGDALPAGHPARLGCLSPGGSASLRRVWQCVAASTGLPDRCRRTTCRVAGRGADAARSDAQDGALSPSISGCRPPTAVRRHRCRRCSRRW